MGRCLAVRTDEIFWIAREALTNAFRHAGASRVSVELRYGVRYFLMVCADNGRGFDPGMARRKVIGTARDGRAGATARRAVAGS